MKRDSRYNAPEIAKYAQEHTVAEVAERFQFPSVQRARTYLNNHGIPFAKAVKNDVLDWLLRNLDCRMCRDFGWDRECERSNEECNAFLKQKLRPYFRVPRSK